MFLISFKSFLSSLFVFVGNNFIPILVAILLGVAIYFIYASKKEKKRIKAIKDYCEEHFIAYEEMPDSITGKTEAYDIYKLSEFYEFFNGMYKKVGDYEINIVDFRTFNAHKPRHQRGGNGIKIYKRYTLCQIYNPSVLFPKFFIKKRRLLLDYFFSWLNEDIVFEEDKAFSDKFILIGKNERDIREFFSDVIRRVFKNIDIEDFVCESGDNSLLLYCKGYADIYKRLSMMDKVMSLFRQIEQEGIKYKIEKKKRKPVKHYVPKKSMFENLGL